MKGKEVRLINGLRRNSRSSLTEISCYAGMPLPTAFKALKRLESKAIAKHICLLDFAKLGFPLKLSVFINTDRKKEAIAFLTAQPNLNTLLSLSGDFDFYAELYFKNMASCQDFIEEMKSSECIKNFSHHFVSDVKLEEFVIKQRDSKGKLYK